MVATVVSSELQFALIVRSAVVPSEKCPVAVNCCMWLTWIIGLIGVMSIPVSVGPLWLEPQDAPINASNRQNMTDALLLIFDIDAPSYTRWSPKLRMNVPEIALRRRELC